jgi:hypothetical protein
MSIPSEIRHAHDTGVLGWLDKLLIAVWRGSTIEGAEVFYDEMKRGFERYQKGVGHLAVIEPKTPMPPSEARQRISQVFDEYPKSCSCVAVVFEGTGFFASAVGSVASGIMLLTGRNTPFKVCNSLPEAALFIAQHMTIYGEPMSPGVCKQAVDHLRGQIKQQRASMRPSRPPSTPPVSR